MQGPHQHVKVGCGSVTLRRAHLYHSMHRLNFQMQTVSGHDLQSYLLESISQVEQCIERDALLIATDKCVASTMSLRTITDFGVNAVSIEVCDTCSVSPPDCGVDEQ